jgi:uncharacterized protein
MRKGIYVNLFIPSDVDWVEKGLKLRQDTRFPDSATKLTVISARPSVIEIRLRVPGWLESAPAVKLNNRALEISAAPGSYLTLKREWKPGDTIEMQLPMRLRKQSMPDDPTLEAYLYGPLVLTGDLGNEGLTEAHITGPNLRVGFPGIEQCGSPLAATNSTPSIASTDIPTFRAASEVKSWIKPADRPLTFRTTGQKQGVTLVPLNRLFDRRYAVYWRVA